MPRKQKEEDKNPLEAIAGVVGDAVGTVAETVGDAVGAVLPGGDAGTPAVLVIRYDWRMNSVLFVHNLDSKPREVSFSAGVDDDRGKLLVNLLTNDHSRANERGRHQLLLQAYDYRWYRVGGLDYLLNRSEIDKKRDE